VLFGADVPAGFVHRGEFITIDEEAGLVDDIGRVEFSNFEMRGVVARRRVAFFGRSYDNASAASLPLPEFLMPLRERVGAWAGIDASAFVMALINEYRPGAPIGWHRDLVLVPDEVPPLRLAERSRVDQTSRAHRNARDHARAAICVLDDRRIQKRVRTSHSRRQHAALFDHVPNAARLSAVSCGGRW
jgi:hypothetical protein